MDIGFIGVGSMGTRIVNLMLDAGHHLTLWARRPASLEPFVGRVDVAATPRQVALASDMVGICVWDEGDVEQVLVRDDGVLSGARPESVISIHSTISPASCLRFQDAAAAVGAQLIDATVSVGSNLPKLLVMVGGERVAVDKCRDALAAVGDPLLHLGPLGSGQMAKLVNNTMVAATIGLGEDALSLGAALGLDAGALSTALASGSARGTWSTFVNRSPHAMDGSPPYMTEWARKDVGHALTLASEAGVDLDRDIFRLARRGVDVVG